MLTEKQIKIIKQSWGQLRGVNAVTIGDVFYRKLFIDEPQFKHMFKSSVEEQSKKLIEMLSLIVARVDRLDELTEDVKQLAIRHVNYGVKDKHYESVGGALIWTLQVALGKDWNDETEEAWTKCYQILASTMIDATKIT